MIFANIYGDVFAHIDDRYGVITFPQNFTPVPGVDYPFLNIRETRTGEFTYESGKGKKTYRVARAYHPDYDARYVDVKADKTADIMDEIDYKFRPKETPKSESPFAALSRVLDKDKLPVQEQPVRDHLQFAPHGRPIGMGATLLMPAICYNSGRKEKREIDFEVTDKSVMFKVANRQLRTGHRLLSENLGSKGMVVFVKENVRIPELVGLKVTGFSKSGNAAFAVPIHGPDKELFNYYDTALNMKEEAKHVEQD